jgi:hypothetical protein
MRTLVVPLAVVALLALVGPSRAELDSDAIAAAKAKPTQATGATFGDGMANKRLARKFVLSNDGWFDFAVANLAPPPAILPWPFPAPPQHIIKNPSNIPRPKR